LKSIQGVVVEYPLYFLDEEKYLPSFGSREGTHFLLIEPILFIFHLFFCRLGIVPVVTWT
jgi:hypothetical protein